MGPLRGTRRWVRSNKPNLREDFITTRTAESFNVRSLVGMRVDRAKQIIAKHSCVIQFGVSWLMNVEGNRVDVRVRHGRIIWARVF